MRTPEEERADKSREAKKARQQRYREKRREGDGKKEAKVHKRRASSSSADDRRRRRRRASPAPDLSEVQPQTLTQQAAARPAATLALPVAETSYAATPLPVPTTVGAHSVQQPAATPPTPFALTVAEAYEEGRLQEQLAAEVHAEHRGWRIMRRLLQDDPKYGPLLQSVLGRPNPPLEADDAELAGTALKIRQRADFMFKKAREGERGRPDPAPGDGGQGHGDAQQQQQQGDRPPGGGGQE